MLLTTARWFDGWFFVVVLSCPRLAVGQRWLPCPSTAVSTSGVFQRKKAIKLLCLPALSFWHRVSQSQLAHPPSQQQQPWQELPGWVLPPASVKAALSFHPSSFSPLHPSSLQCSPHKPHFLHLQPTNHSLLLTCPPPKIPETLTSFLHQTSPLIPLHLLLPAPGT